MTNISNDLTVIIPAFNCEKTIKECINSVLNIDEKIKIIVINDGSTDDTLKKCEDYINYNNIKVISTKNNGVSHARNLGISHCETKFLMFLDSDDILVPNLKNVIYDYDENADVLKLSFIIKKRKSNNIIFETSEYSLDKDYNIFFEKFFSSPDYNMIWGQIIKAEVIKNNNIAFNEELTFSEDILFNYFLYKNSKKICFSSSIGYMYLDNSNSLTRKKEINSIKKRLYDGIEAFGYIYRSEEVIFKSSIVNKSLHEIFPQILSLAFYIKKYKKILLVYNEIYNMEAFEFIRKSFISSNYKDKYRGVIKLFMDKKFYLVFIFSRYIYINLKRIKKTLERIGLL